MTHRPYFNDGLEQLSQRAHTYWDDVETLQRVMHELSFRTTNGARQLASRVSTRVLTLRQSVASEGISAETAARFESEQTLQENRPPSSHEEVVVAATGSSDCDLPLPSESASASESESAGTLAAPAERVESDLTTAIPETRTLEFLGRLHAGIGELTRDWSNPGYAQCPDCREFSLHREELGAYGSTRCYNCQAYVTLITGSREQNEGPDENELFVQVEQDLERDVDHLIDTLTEHQPDLADYLRSAVATRRNVGRLAEYQDELRAEVADAEARLRQHSLGACHDLGTADLVSLARKYWSDPPMLQQIQRALSTRSARRATALLKEVTARPVASPQDATPVLIVAPAVLGTARLSGKRWAS